MTSTPSSPTLASATRRRESIAILVHGTFAASESNTGSKWWQAESPFAEKLNRHLPQSVRLAQHGEVFHWSGKNSERSRSKAALRLLQHLEPQESDGKDYHLVGHSHGGSVIWHALKLATVKRKKLNGLRSWTTVGTPFLQHQSRSAFSPLNIMSIVLAAMLIVPFWRSVTTVTSAVHHAITNDSWALKASPESEAGYGIVLRAPMIAAVEYLGVRVDRRPDGIYFGSYDPESGVTLREYLFMSKEGLVLLTCALVHVYLGLQLIVWCITPALESRRIRREARLEKHAYYRFGSRWLGLWSRDDEAINGLRATLSLSMRFVGKMMPTETVFISDVTSILSRPIRMLVSPVFNRVIQPILDRYVRNVVVRSAQGNDRPTATLVQVTPTPLKEVCHDFAELPPRLNERLVSYADSHTTHLAPKLRRLLAQPSFGTGMESFANEISGQELVHTSYFDHDEIAALICCNIILGTPRVQLPDGGVKLSPDLLDWFEVTKRELSRNCAPDPIRIANHIVSVSAKAA